MRQTRPGWSGNNEVEERIYDMVKNGSRMFKDILPIYPKYYATIARLMLCRKPRDFITHVLHIWGPSGIGKTTAIYEMLSTLQDMNIADFYFKGGGLKKYWDGYDNQPIVWIDDPVMLDSTKDSESVQQLKNVFSTGNAVVEVKYGSLTFDSKLVIITSNPSPEYLAGSCGQDNYEPILRRLTDACGSWRIDEKEYCRSNKFKKQLFRIIRRSLDHININDVTAKEVIENITSVKKTNFDDLDLINV